MTSTKTSNGSFIDDPLKDVFEKRCRFNGRSFWYASDLMAILGYETLTPLQRPIDRAIATCRTLEIPVSDHFVPETRVINQVTLEDYRLSRFACYLTIMRGDRRRPQVAAAQTYFNATIESFCGFSEEPDDLERLLVREEISDHERIMNGIAKEAGASDYRLFQNAGYRGMYNMDLRRLKEVKRVDGDRTLLDFMTKLELTAHLLRIKQTEARIRKGIVPDQKNLEAIAEEVGRAVRRTMIEISGDHPEDLAVADDLRLVRHHLKKTNEAFDKLDARRKNNGLGYSGLFGSDDELQSHNRGPDNLRRAS